MRSGEEVKKALAEIESDERLHYPPADVFSNASLELVQVELKARRSVLKWVLGPDDEEQKDHGSRK